MPSGYSIFTHCLFDAAEKKLDCYRGKDCIERFCKDLREHAMQIINYEKIKINDTTNWWWEYKLWNTKRLLHMQKNLVLMKMMEMHLKYIIKYKIIVITLKNLERVLIAFVI